MEWQRPIPNSQLRPATRELPIARFRVLVRGVKRYRLSRRIHPLRLLITVGCLQTPLSSCVLESTPSMALSSPHGSDVTPRHPPAVIAAPRRSSRPKPDCISRTSIKNLIRRGSC